MHGTKEHDVKVIADVGYPPSPPPSQPIGDDLSVQATMTENINTDNYHPKLARLKLWYVWHLVDRVGISFDEAINQRVRLHWYFGSTESHLAPSEWFDLVDQLKRLFASVSDVETWVRESYAALKPTVEQRVRLESETSTNSGCGCSARLSKGAIHHHCLWIERGDVLHSGCFWVERKPTSDSVALHFSNLVSPESPFSDMPSLAASLLRFLGKFEGDHDTVQCGSWLNSRDDFQSLFPQTWRLSAKSMPFNNHARWWGQFRHHTGGFHDANAARFQRTGDFPYASLFCQCTIRELIEYIESSYGF